MGKKYLEIGCEVLMSDRTMMVLWAIVTEVVAVTVFGFLAWKFNHWWIALFSIAFMKSLKFGVKDGENKDVSN